MILDVQTFSLADGSRPNQDSFGVRVLDEDQLVAVVADGVGGNVGGEVASSIAVELALQAFDVSNPRPAFEQIFNRAVKALKVQASENPALSEMATTLTLLVLDGKCATFAHVGDSRLYHLRGNGIVQKTEDQSEGAVLVKQGILSPSRARTYARRSVLVSALSAHGEYELTQGAFELLPGDRLLLVTDGVYRLMSKREILDLSLTSPSAEHFATALRHQALRHGLEDDTTLICITCD